MEARNSNAAVSPYISGLRGRCPRCGKGKLFAGYLHIAPRCSNCSLDYSFAESGDGPAAFVILIAGFVVVMSALATEVIWRPPYWVHAALWLPAIVILSLVLLRLAKGLLITLQYHHKAEEGRLDRGAP